MPTDTTETIARILPADLRELLRTRVLLLQRPVWGRRHGRHRSARAGMGLDFRDHRAYVPGDDPRRLDWRAVARRDRLVLRQTESEDELPVVLVVDEGGSMAYGEGDSAKSVAARAFAGGLAWLAVRQGDTVGLAVGRDGTTETSLARPSGGQDRVNAIARALSSAKPSGWCPWSRLLAETVPRLPRRSLVIVLSDFLDPSEPDLDADVAQDRIFGGLSSLRASQHDVVLVQVLHRDELTFPWAERNMLRFLDLRGVRPEVEGPGGSLREGYLARLAEHLRALELRCEREGLYLHRLVTDAPVASAFAALLARLSGSEMVGTATEVQP